MQTLSINVVTRTQDNGDGGYTTYAYNNVSELIADHPKSMRWDSKKRRNVKVQLTEAEIATIMNDEDSYENGYIGRDVIKIVIDDSGVARLAAPISFSAGQ